MRAQSLLCLPEGAHTLLTEPSTFQWHLLSLPSYYTKSVLSALRMNQTEECTTKRVFRIMIWFNNVFGT